MTEQAWESLCRRCGGCCFEKKVSPGGKLMTTSVPCRFLDVHSRSCTIYERRFDVVSDCTQLTEENIKTFHWLPSECGYRQILLNVNTAKIK